MGAKTKRQKGDSRTVRERSRDYVIERLRDGVAEIPRRHGNGILRLQTQQPTQTEGAA